VSQENLEGQKFALLIGVSECYSGFQPLRCPPNGIETLYNILTNPDLGGFRPDQVVTLANPDVGRMQASIGELFSRCNHRDLVLLYFTGHGVIDQNGDFYFTTRETRKLENSSLNRGTAVAASFVRNEMSGCLSRRQVVILDCCFSGAFPDGSLAMDDQSINIERELGGEGRAILTAATSTQYALEQEGESLSVYTRYLVQGLGTGAAVPNDHLNSQKFVRVGDLHNYIRDQLKTAAAAMSPQIYAAQEGREIILARVLIDNELRYRKQVQQYLREDGQISIIGQKILKECARQWNITPEQENRIIQEVTQPYQERQDNLEKYATALQAEVDASPQLSEEIRKEVKDYQQILNLRDEDVVPIHTRIEPQPIPEESVPLIEPSVDEPPISPPPPTGNGSSVPPLNLQDYKKIFLGAAVVVAALGVIGGIFISIPGSNTPFHIGRGDSKTPNPSPNYPSPEPAQNLISAGDNQYLYGSRSSSRELRRSVNYQAQKTKGIEYFMAGDYESSLKTFTAILSAGGDQSSSSAPRKDPEILIFRNNSQARLNHQRPGGRPIYTIAAAVPLSDANGEPFNIGQQILFGIAQAQAKAIAEEKINLEVVIANDRNLPNQAEELAKELGKQYITGFDSQQREVLAVIGHYSSTVTCAALPSYNKAGITVISPASTRTDLRSKCGGEKVFFRTISSSAVEAKELVDYLVNKSKIIDPRVAVFYKKGEGFSQDLFDQFKIEVGSSTQISEFDLSNSEDFQKGKRQLSNFNVLAVFPDGRTSDDLAFTRAIEVITIDPGSRLILGSNPLNDWKVANEPRLLDSVDKSNKLKVQLEKPGKGLVLALDWLPGCGSKPEFVGKAITLWGGSPNRMYALSYEAAQVLVARLKQGKTTRSDILDDLGNAANKVTSDVFQDKTISFSQKGDRNEIGNRILVTPPKYGGGEFEAVPGEQSCPP